MAPSHDCTHFSVLGTRGSLGGDDVTVESMTTEPDIPNLQDATHEITTARVILETDTITSAVREEIDDTTETVIVMTVDGCDGELKLVDRQRNGDGTERWELDGFGESMWVSFG